MRIINVNDEPWFVAKDVCEMLGIKTSTTGPAPFVVGLDDEEKRLVRRSEVSNLVQNKVSGVNFPNRGLVAISESGLYKLVLRSNKPDAKPFQDWVTKAVLPAIRKDGVYEGTVIKVNDGMVNLTNMWKACGEDPSMRPNHWTSSVEGRKIALALEEKHIAGNSCNKDLIRTATGRNGGTFAHPVIGLAYAQYLSPDFHIWCNEWLLKSGLIETSDGEFLVKLGEDCLPVEQTNFPTVIRHEEVMVFGAPILVAVLESEEKCVSIRHICEAIGINTQMQQKRLRNDPSFSHLLIDSNVQHTSGAKATIMLPLNRMASWLSMISPNRVKSEVKPALLKYRAEAAAVLDAWFRQNARAATDPNDMSKTKSYDSPSANRFHLTPPPPRIKNQKPRYPL